MKNNIDPNKKDIAIDDAGKELVSYNDLVGVKEEKEVPKETPIEKLNSFHPRMAAKSEEMMDKYLPLQAVDANKEVETVLSIAMKNTYDFLDEQSGLPNEFLDSVTVVPLHCATDVIKDMADQIDRLVKSQSVESIVGFVLEWLEKNEYISSKGKGLTKTIADISHQYKKHTGNGK